ncbi:MAG: hypothetical protein Q7T03_08315 [Deltaproteobacteria bacterium]|nr:hypothetical protein [Deltaproteobacteria bacterium]
MKFLQLLLISYLLYRLVRFAVPGLLRLFLFKNGVKKESGSQRREICDMIPCSRCGTFVSQSVVLSESGKSFCSTKCCEGK